MTTAADLGLLDLATAGAQAAGAELLARYGRIQGLDTKTSATDPVLGRRSRGRGAAGRVDHRGAAGRRPARRGGRVAAVVIGSALGDRSAGRHGQLPVPTGQLLGEHRGRGRRRRAWSASSQPDHRTGRIWATRGGGAVVERSPLQVNDPVPMDRALLGNGFGYSAERRRGTGRVDRRTAAAGRDIRRIGSAALDLCAVAAGAVDGYFEEGVKAWDVAAGGADRAGGRGRGMPSSRRPAPRPAAWPRVRRCTPKWTRELAIASRTFLDKLIL